MLANTCIDSVVFKVFPKPIFLDTLVCSTSLPFILDITANGGSWSGSGIIDNTTGLFDPSLLTLGTYLLEYTSLNGCIDTFEIEIIDPPNLVFSNIKINYCYIDSFFNISTNIALSTAV